jgi:hypothetical protein
VGSHTRITTALVGLIVLVLVGFFVRDCAGLGEDRGARSLVIVDPGR